MKGFLCVKTYEVIFKSLFKCIWYTLKCMWFIAIIMWVDTTHLIWFLNKQIDKRFRTEYNISLTQNTQFILANYKTSKRTHKLRLYVAPPLIHDVSVLWKCSLYGILYLRGWHRFAILFKKEEKFIFYLLFSNLFQYISPILFLYIQSSYFLINHFFIFF